MPKTPTIHTLAGALARWIAMCRDSEDFRGRYERLTGREWDAAKLSGWYMAAKEEPEIQKFIDMAIHVGRRELAEELRSEIEGFYGEYLIDPAPPPSEKLRPVLLVDNAKGSPRRAKAAGGAGSRKGSAAGRTPGGSDAA